MTIIPVIDLKNGGAVHAKLGLRDQYLPLNTPLCASSVVENVIEAFLQVYPFKIFYLADLNAITNSGDNAILIETLLKNYSQITFWVDSGYQKRPSKFVDFANCLPVLGSECYGDNQLSALKLFEKNFVLSLDFSAQQQPLGSPKLFEKRDFWSEKVIVMTLARVGSFAGVDIETLRYFQNRSPQTKFVASGGIRDKADLIALKNIGIEFALCASALHSGKITAVDIQTL